MSRLERAKELVERAMHAKAPEHFTTDEERFKWMIGAAILDLRNAMLLLIDEVSSQPQGRPQSSQNETP